MGFVKNFKDKINEHFVSNEYDEYESAVSDDDFEDASADNNSSIYDNAPESNFTFNPQPGINVPEYSFEPKPATKKKVEAPQVATKNNTNANIYNFNNNRASNKFKLNSILLRDIYDAKNVAALMMERDTIVVVNLSYLSDEQKVRAMDFLDGAKYVTKSVFVRFAENICAFVPESVELFGDFFSQVDIDSFNK